MAIAPYDTEQPMFVTSLKWKFDAESIRGTPRTQGSSGCGTRAGSSTSAPPRAALSFRRAGRAARLQAPRHHPGHPFHLEITITPRSWAGELLRLHFNKHGELPLYNQPASALQQQQDAANPATGLPLP
jgi:hypothetical protein